MSKPIRVLVASALGHVVAPVLNQRYDKVTVVTSGEELEALLPRSLRYDVAVIDLLWNSLHLEWRYDGLDAIQQLRGADKESPVILAAQGHGFERDYLEEARDDGSVKGTLLKSAGIPALLW